ncbi:MAG: ATP-grasp domain-containing protein [Chloroflexi bacterium]|nr:ATP-grasp domain-containing protein [Chloroflexota bacterium]
MIFLFGSGRDGPVRATARALKDASVPFVFADQDEPADRAWLEGDGPDHACLVLDGAAFPLGERSAAYARLERPVPTDHAAQRFVDRITDWLEVTGALVVNRPSLMATNYSKPGQLQVIARAGFLVPDTLITNDPDRVRAFAREHARVVFKSISSVRSIVTELTRDADLSRVRWSPVQFQEFVEGLNVRVHVIGRDVFATAIETDTIDYRYAQRYGSHVRYAPHELDSTVADACRHLAAELGLMIAGLDLKFRADGAPYCFEVNPSPAFSHYEDLAGQQMSDAVVDLLREGPTSPRH